MRAGIVAAVLVALASVSWGHENPGKKPAVASVEEKSFGRAADPHKAKRTVRVEMSDAMRFAPEVIRVKRGEVIRFVPANRGKVMHEMILGTLEELKQHAELMRRHPHMEHEEAHMAHVAPGKTGEIAWQFTRAGEFYFACLIPGHFEAGMMGRITVVP